MAIRHGVRENWLFDPNSATAADCAAFIARAEMWVWVEDGQVQGFSDGDPSDGTIWALFVAPAFEGRCIGRTLLALACGTLRGAGHEMARLNTEAGTRAERSYRTNGWMAVGRSSKSGAGCRTPRLGVYAVFCSLLWLAHAAADLDLARIVSRISRSRSIVSNLFQTPAVATLTYSAKLNRRQ